MTAGCAGTSPAPWASPDGRLVLRADAPRSAWLQRRTSGIGSSDASAIVGVNRWTSPYEVWAEKRGLIPPTPDSDAMELGRLLEPVIADRWSEKSGIPVRRAGLMASRERPWQLASVDRLAACGGVAEIKTLSYRVAEEWEGGQTPDHAEVQVQHQLAVTGRDHAHVVGLQDGRTWLERVVVRDDDLIADLVKIEDHFWHELVLGGVEPDVDASAATTDILNRRWPGAGERLVNEHLEQLVAAHRAAAAHAAEADEALDLAKNRLRAALGDHTEGWTFEPDLDDKKAKPAVTWRRNGAFSSTALAEQWPDLHQQLLTPVTTDVVDVARLKAEHPDIYTACRARVLRVSKPKEN